jgi:hypothetical protein
MVWWPSGAVDVSSWFANAEVYVVFHSVENTVCCIDEDDSVLSIMKLGKWTSWADAIANTDVLAEEASDVELLTCALAWKKDFLYVHSRMTRVFSEIIRLWIVVWE